MSLARKPEGYHSDVTTLVRPDALSHEDPDGLRARVAELEATLTDRGAEVARLKSELDAFRISYRHQVGILHEQLDELELALAEAELGELANRQAGRDQDPRPSPAEVKSAPPRFTSDGVRKLFRDVARAIHPDLAPDAAARDQRHTLMIEANRAYAEGDAAQLRWILDAWERSPEAVQGSDTEAVRLRLERRIAQIEEQLALLATDLAELQASSVWRMKALVDEAAARGKDLVGDMVRRLKRDIMVATNRLDALRPPADDSPHP